MTDEPTLSSVGRQVEQLAESVAAFGVSLTALEARMARLERTFDAFGIEMRAMAQRADADWLPGDTDAGHRPPAN